MIESDLLGKESHVFYATCPMCGEIIINKETGKPVDLMSLINEDVQTIETDLMVCFGSSMTKSIVLPRSGLEVTIGLPLRKEK